MSLKVWKFTALSTNEIEGYKRKEKESIKYRGLMEPLTEDQRTSIIGKIEMLNIMASEYWRNGDGEQMDAQKVDSTFRLGRAQIDIQLKSSKLNKYGIWNWHIFSPNSNKKEKEIKFYDNDYDFLFLSGVYLEDFYRYDNYELTRYQIRRAVTQQFALIPGKVVLDYFSRKSHNARILSLSNKKLSKCKYPEFKEYFGLTKIHSLLEKTKEMQEEEQKHLEEWRKRKEN